MKKDEHIECVAFAKSLKMMWNRIVLFAKIPTEIWTPSIWQIMSQKAEWMTSWVPDYLIIVKCKSWKKRIVFVEMKKCKWWVVSESQKKRINELLECWVNAKVCEGSKKAIEYISYIIDAW